MNGYENFVEQINTCKQHTSSDFGVSVGLFNQQWWDIVRYYFVNVSRSEITDKKMARNIKISFTNNSLVPIDIVVFTIYADDFTIDVESGFIQK